MRTIIINDTQSEQPSVNRKDSGDNPKADDACWVKAFLCGHTHSLTHSLTTSRSSSIRVDHSDIFLLHCARTCDIFSWMYSQPIHSSMSCRPIHCLLGLQWCRSPSMIPSRTVSANCPALPRVMWPQYCSFSFPLTLFEGPILLILNHLYGFLATWAHEQKNDSVYKSRDTPWIY